MMDRLNTALIIAGFFVFLAVPFVSNHLVTPNTIHEVLDNPEQASLVARKMRGLMGSKTSILTLQNKLNDAFDLTNQSILAKYSLTNDQLNQLAALMTANRLNQETVDSLFIGEENAFIGAAFNSYGNWLYGKGYASQEAATTVLAEIKTNIYNYEKIPKLGFDKYKKKPVLKYEVYHFKFHLEGQIKP